MAAGTPPGAGWRTDRLGHDRRTSYRPHHPAAARARGRARPRPARGCAATTGELTFAGRRPTFAAAVGRTGAAPPRCATPACGAATWSWSPRAPRPPYLLCWLALTSLGAVTVAVNPRSTPAELAGLIGQVRPRALITDAGLAAWSPRRRPRSAGSLAPRVLDVRDARPRWADRGWPRRRLAGRRRRPRRPGGADPDLRARPAGPSWSCRRTGRTRWRGRASRSGWS